MEYARRTRLLNGFIYSVCIGQSVLASAVFAGDNAGATFRQIGERVFDRVGPGTEVAMQIAADGLVGATAMELVFEVSPAAAFDPAATAFEVPIAWFVSGEGNKAAANNVLRATLTTAADFSPGAAAGNTRRMATASIAVGRISVGPINAEADIFDGADLELGITVNPSVATAVLEDGQPAAAMALEQNFPNPFNPETNIRFDLGQAAGVTLKIYDSAGQTVRTLVNGETLAAGTYRQTWDGRNQAGERVGSGLYFYRLQADDFISIRKMTLLK